MERRSGTSGGLSRIHTVFCYHILVISYVPRRARLLPFVTHIFTSAQYSSSPLQVICDEPCQGPLAAIHLSLVMYLATHFSATTPWLSKGQSV